MLRNKGFLFLFAVFFATALSGIVLAASPNGATVSSQSNSTAQSDSPEGHASIAGNLTEVILSGTSLTQAWQGYYGNVSGAIELADASGNAFYNWSQTSAVGEVFASINNSITWSTISCLNLTERESTIESEFGIDSGDLDGLSETFNLNNHAPFDVGSVSFSSGQCNNTKVFGPSGAATFDEILLDDASNRTVFTSVLDDNTAGFDGALHDFEMLVLENGHGNTALTTYYFYVELG